MQNKATASARSNGSPTPRPTPKPILRASLEPLDSCATGSSASLSVACAPATAAVELDALDVLNGAVVGLKVAKDTLEVDGLVLALRATTKSSLFTEHPSHSKSRPFTSSKWKLP